MTLSFMPVKIKMLKKFMLIQIYYVLGHNIFALHFLTNGLRKVMENLSLENRIFHHNYLTLFLGNMNDVNYNYIYIYIFTKYNSNHYYILGLFIAEILN